MSNAQVTREEIQSGLQTIRAIADAIREAKRIPSGQLYAVVMGKLSLASYEKVIGILERSGLVRNVNHELEWIEPSAAA